MHYQYHSSHMRLLASPDAKEFTFQIGRFGPLKALQSTDSTASQSMHLDESSTGLCCNVAIGWEGCLANGCPQGPIYGQNRQRTASNRLLESQSSNGLQQSTTHYCVRTKQLAYMFAVRRKVSSPVWLGAL